MKALKITFVVLVLLVLTVSGTSINSVEKLESDVQQFNQAHYDLITHTRKKATVESQG